ncbi:hypothetical protein GCM10027395_26830 [Giesbergeria sinuosa]
MLGFDMPHESRGCPGKTAQNACYEILQEKAQSPKQGNQLSLSQGDSFAQFDWSG